MIRNILRYHQSTRFLGELMGHVDKGVRNYNPSLTAQQTKSGKAYLDKIRKMEPYERFLYWIKERQRIYTEAYPKGLGLEADGIGYVRTQPPWSDDPIFQTIFFCNVYRENDRVTSYLREYYRKPFAEEQHVFLGSILLRWYNYIPTIQKLINAKIPHSFRQPDKRRPPVGRRDGWALAPYLKLLVGLRDDHDEQLFGGAYIIRPIVDGKKNARKVESIGELFTAMARDKTLYLEVIGRTDYGNVHLSPKAFEQLGSTTDSNDPGTMSYAFARLRQFSGMGKFYNYQFIGDLAYTHVLRDAPDWFTWSFCGPGTSRGLVRLKCRSGQATLPNGKRLPRLMPLQRGWQEQLIALQQQVNKDLGVAKSNGRITRQKAGGEVRDLQPIHMRDLTNCLCEYDKYERALFNERSIKRPYDGC